MLLFVLRGGAVLCCDGRPEEPPGKGDAAVVPGGLRHRLDGCASDLELLEVTLPAMEQ